MDKLPSKLSGGDRIHLEIHPQMSRHIVLKIFIVLIVSVVVVFVINIVTKPMIQSLSCDTSDPACKSSKRIQTITVVVRSIIIAIAVVVAIGIILQLVGVNIGSILIAAGIGGIIIGLGAQSVIRDVINGITIISENQISEGDYITVNFPHAENMTAVTGTVKEVTIRILTVAKDDGSVVFIPNGNISHITNHSRENTNITVKVFVENTVNPEQIQQSISSLLLQLGRYPLYSEKYTVMPHLVGITSSDKTGYYVTVQAASSPDDASEIENFIRSNILSLFHSIDVNNNTVNINVSQNASPTDVVNGGGGSAQPKPIVPIPTP